MLVIRLARGGRSKYPTYRIVAAESSRAATGKFVEILGHYNPHTKELVIKKEETLKRLSNGAQPSNSVVKLLQKENIEVPEWVKLKTKVSKPKKEPVEKPAAEPVAEEAAAEDAPAEEAPAAEETPAVEETAPEALAEEEVRVAEAATENEAAVEEKADEAKAEAEPEVETTEDAK